MSDFVSTAPSLVAPTTTTIAKENPPVPSTSRVCASEGGVSTPSIHRKKTFEELLLEQIKQTPKITTGRKRICVDAEVITSEDAIAKLEEIENKRLKKKVKIIETMKKITEDNSNEDGELEKLETFENKEKWKKKATKKKPLFEEDSSDDDTLEDIQSLSSNTTVDDMEEMNEEINFLNQMQLDLLKINVGDWIVVKFNQRKQVKMVVYIGKIL